MPKFVLTFEGGRAFKTPEDGQAHQAAYGQWLENLGNSIVLPQHPFKQSKMVSKDGVSDPNGPAFMGLMMIEAADMEAAVPVAQACPFLEIGEMRVAETMTMKG